MDSREQVKTMFQSVQKKIVASTSKEPENKTLKKLTDKLTELVKIVSSHEFLDEAFEKEFTPAVALYHNLVRDGVLAQDEDIKNDLKKLKKLIKESKKTNAGSNYVPLSVATNSNRENVINPVEKWMKKAECNEQVKLYHRTFATQPVNNEAKKFFEDLMNSLRSFLSRYNLCDRMEYTGSVYETLNICGDILEFDVMFVVRNKDLQTSDSNIPGYSYIKPKSTSSFSPNLLNERGFLEPEQYRRYFYGLIDKFLKENEHRNIKQRNHGVACQLDVFKNDQIWFQVDLVPCFDINNSLYVPKPTKVVTGATDVWRKSYSLEEKQELKKIDGVNECRKQCIRITKALFKLHTNGIFKEFTSYCIKTIAFKVRINNDISWSDQNLCECIVYFLNEIVKCLECQCLMHHFQNDINLLEHSVNK